MATATKVEIKIDEEFEKALPPLGEKEYEQLLVSLSKEGCREPLILWKGHGVLIDGHNRYAICTENEIDFETVEKAFPDRRAVKRWILTNQLARRNLTQPQMTMIIGEVYKLDKGEVGGDGSNQHKEQLSQNGTIAADKKSTAEKVGETFGVSKNTVLRAEKFADAVNALPEDVAAPILSGKAKLTHAEVVALPAKTAKEQREAVAESQKPNRKKKEEPVAEEKPVAIPADVKKVLDLIPLFNDVLLSFIPEAKSNARAIKKVFTSFQVQEVDNLCGKLHEIFKLVPVACSHCKGKKCAGCSGKGWVFRS